MDDFESRDPEQLGNGRNDVQTVGGGSGSGASTAPMPANQPNGWFVGPAEEPDRYELLGEGISGGEGITWRARYHGSLDSPLPIAVKVLFPSSDTPDGWPTEADRSRWQDQTALMRHMRLDHLVRVNDITSGAAPHRAGESSASKSEHMIIEMEWVEGQNVSTAVRSDPTTAHNVKERAGWVADACSALAELHSHTRTAGNPLVHRDVTPSNCMVTNDRGLVLIDVSTLQLPRDGFDPAGRHTPSYSAPEVLAMPHNPRKPSADRYAIGALAFYCLTGQDPPPASATDAAASIRRALADSVRRLAVKPQIVNHVMAMLSIEAERRPKDLREWAEQFRRLATPRRLTIAVRWMRRPLVAVPLAALIIGLGISGGAIVAGNDPIRSNVRAASSAGGPVSAALGLSRTSFATTEGRITSPAPQARVRSCEYFTGTATIRPGYTLILGMHNLSESDSVRYVQVVYGFDKPETLSTWRGAQYFNDGAIGQQTMVELIEVPLKDAIRANQTDDYLEASRIATQGRVLAAVIVVHIKKQHPTGGCEG